MLRIFGGGNPLKIIDVIIQLITVDMINLTFIEGIRNESSSDEAMNETSFSDIILEQDDRRIRLTFLLKEDMIFSLKTFNTPEVTNLIHTLETFNINKKFKHRKHLERMIKQKKRKVNTKLMAGWKTDQIMAGLPSTLDLAAASDMDLARTADIVSDGLTAFHMNANEVQRFNDVLAATSTSANTNVEMMGETFKYVGAVAGAAGYSIEDSALAIGIMANSGIKASMAGTALRSTMNRLINPPKQAAMALEKIGFSATTADGQLKPFKQQIMELREKFKGMTKAEQVMNAKMIAGAEAAAGFSALMTTSDEDVAKLESQIMNSEGATKRMADTMQNNFEGSLVKVDSAIESVYTAMGSTFLPVLTQAGNAIAENIGNFGVWVGEHQSLVQWIGLLAAGLAGLIVLISGVGLAMSLWGFMSATISSIVMGVTMAKEAFLGLSIVQRLGAAASMAWSAAQAVLNAAMMANPVGVVIGGILLLVGVIALIISQCDGLKAALMSAWNDPAGAINGFVNLIKSSIDSAINYVMERINTIKSVMSNPLEAAANFVSTGSVIGGNVQASSAEAEAVKSSGISEVQAQTVQVNAEVSEQAQQATAVEPNIEALEQSTAAIQANNEARELEAQIAAEKAANAYDDIDDKDYLEDMMTVITPMTESMNQITPNMQMLSESTTQLTPNMQMLSESTTQLSPNMQMLNENSTTVNTSLMQLSESVTNASTSLMTINEAATSAGSGLSIIGESANACASALSSAAAQISSIHITIPTVSTAPIASNAEGGIYRQGSFLTTFAENSPEAAIPIDGSSRAISLWQQVGTMLGVYEGASPILETENPTAELMSIAVGGGENKLNLLEPPVNEGFDINFSPIINISGNEEAREGIEEILRTAVEDIEEKIRSVLRENSNRERRLSYGS